MAPHEGYLVVLRSQLPTETLYNPRYKGLYRIPPFSMKKYRDGFDDPYVFGKYVTAEGLIPDLMSAQEVLRRFTQIEPVENLEVICVRDRADVPSRPVKLEGLQLLGFDVASDRPFWSIVNDSPPPSDPRFERYLSLLNEHGLFDFDIQAREYLDAYLSHFPKDQDKGLRVWEVDLVEQAS